MLIMKYCMFLEYMRRWRWSKIWFDYWLVSSTHKLRLLGLSVVVTSHSRVKLTQVGDTVENRKKVTNTQVFSYFPVSVSDQLYCIISAHGINSYFISKADQYIYQLPNKRLQ